MTPRPVAIVVALVLALALMAPAAADGAIVVRSWDARVDFPRSIGFTLDAEAAAGVTDVQLQVSTPGQRYGNATRNVRPRFTPGQSVRAEWLWPRFGSALPPGSEVVYRWRITDAAGGVLETPARSVRVDDPRHAWREASDGLVTVRWYRGGDAFGRTVLAAARDSVAHLERDQGVTLQSPLTIHIYGSQQDLFEAVPGAPGWIGGIAIPDFDTVMLGIAPDDLDWGRRALTHEIAHQVIYQMTFHPTLGSRVPTWLNEGLAVVAEGETEAKTRELLDEAVRTDTLPTLRSLSGGFSGRGGHLAGVAYAASESAVRFLLARGGPEQMRSVLLALAEGVNADDAARRVYGRSLDQLEDEWRTSLNLTPRDRSGGGPSSRMARPEAGVPATLPAPAQRDALVPAWLPWTAGGLALLALLAAAGGLTLALARRR
jgi:hypothetical protein